MTSEEAARLRERVLQDKFGDKERDPLAANLFSILNAYKSYEDALEGGQVTEEVAADHFGVTEDKRLINLTPENALLSGRFAPKAILKHMDITREKLAQVLRGTEVSAEAAK